MNVFLPLSRREWLTRTACGFGSLALAGLAASTRHPGRPTRSPAKTPHHAPKAKRVIFLFMQGGVSQVDSFDYKPRLDKDDGKMLRLRRRPRHRQHRQARLDAAGDEAAVEVRPARPDRGRWASDLFPEINKHVDDLCFVHSHAHRGRRPRPGDAVPALRLDQLRPAVDGLVGRCTASAPRTRTCPASCRIAPSAGNGGPRNYGNAFLPAVYQGTALGKAGGAGDRGDHPQPRPARCSPTRRSKRSSTCSASCNAEQLKRTPGDAELEAVIDSYELAWRMQTQRPGRARPVEGDRPRRCELYGIGEKATDNFGRQCLMARRLCEAGVRLHAGDLRRQHAPTRRGTSTRTCPSTATTPRPSTSRSPACSPT